MLSPALFRLNNDIEELDLPKGCTVNKHSDSFKLEIGIIPSTGPFANIEIFFDFSINDDYPITAPKVICKNNIFHPNILPYGSICLNILRLGWMPVYTLNYIVFALIDILENPASDDALNEEAAEVLKSSFEEYTKRAHDMLIKK